MNATPPVAGRPRSRLDRYALGMAAVWTLFMSVMLGWLVVEYRKTIISEAQLQAQIGLQKNFLFFKWAATFERIYVTQKSSVPLSHRLMHGEEEYVDTVGGRTLGRLSPMTVFRQVLEMGRMEYGQKSRLTSLTPMSPANAPDAWERAALESFGRGATEAAGLGEVGGQSVMRVMRPIAGDASCMSCHGDPRARVNGLSGGVSVAVPMAPLWQAGREQLSLLATGWIVIWLLGLGTIAFVAQRVRESNARLAAARDQALEFARLKSEFLATMSHEIRTPMNGVLGMASLLAHTSLNTEQSEYVRTIAKSGESLMTILNDILDYSKIEAGAMELERHPFDLRQCLEDALDLFAARAAEKNIELLFLLGPGVPGQVSGDATRLRQILVNLLGNALKFTAAGEVVLTVDAEPVDERVRLRVAIKDTGIGIPPEGMKRLFHSFSQIDASTSRRYGGTGLGLAISKRLAELMGGTMWAESSPGEGSTFFFTVMATPSPQRVQLNLHARQPDLAGRRLLVVDDNETNRRIVRSYASGWGMAVREAAAPAEALATLRADPGCDVVMIDMQMPGMDGETLAAEIHRLPACAALPLLLLSSLGRRPKSVDFAEALMKPVKPAALYGAICASVGVEARLARASERPAPVFDATLGQRCSLRLLAAEDNVVNQRVIRLMLEHLGYGATIVADGRAVLEACARQDFEVILMDVEMPEMDGCEAARRLRGLPGNDSRRPWIVAVTASAAEEDRQRVFAAGMNDFVTKPVRPAALAEVLARAHAAVRQSAAPSRSPVAGSQ